MDKASRFTSASDFKKVFEEGRSIVTKSIVLKILPNKTGTGENRIGFCIGKRIGKAVIRNKTKRVLKEVYRRNSKKLDKPYDIVVVKRKAPEVLTYKAAEKELLEAFRKAELLKNG